MSNLDKSKDISPFILLNILFMVITDEVLKLDKSNVFIYLQSKNKWFIYKTEEVSKEDKSNESILLWQNIHAILITDEVLKFVKLIYCKLGHSLSIPFISITFELSKLEKSIDTQFILLNISLHDVKK